MEKELGEELGEECVRRSRRRMWSRKRKQGDNVAVDEVGKCGGGSRRTMWWWRRK